MERKILRVGITGHRKILRKDLDKLPGALEEEFLKKIGENKDSIILVQNGVALGFDQLAAEVVCKIQDMGESYREVIHFTAFVPFLGQECLWPPSQQERYKELLTRAREVVVVSPGEYEAWKMHRRNKEIVDNSDEFFVYWDGHYTGGTGNCMKLLKNKKLPWKNFYVA